MDASALEAERRERDSFMKEHYASPIPEEHLEKIFSRFFSYRRNGTEGDGHTGLGLASVTMDLPGTARPIDGDGAGDDQTLLLTAGESEGTIV